MRSLIAVSATLLLAAACGESVTPKPVETPPAVMPTSDAAVASAGPVQGAAESLAPEAVTVPTAVPASVDLFEGLAAGESATFKTDACPAAYDNVGKLGSISCNAQYKVFYEASTMRWAAVGPDRGLGGAISAAKNPGPAPSEHIIVIWGLGLTVKPETFEVLHGDGAVIGHLVHSTPAISVTPETPKSVKDEPAKSQ